MGLQAGLIVCLSLTAPILQRPLPSGYDFLGSPDDLYLRTRKVYPAELIKPNKKIFVKMPIETQF
jgi:hypothetical protein